MKNQTALITGATSGIGHELAKLFAADGYNLVLVARNRSPLSAMITRMELLYPDQQFTYIEKDLSIDGAAEEIYQETTSKGIIINVLVNDAGIGEAGKFAETDLKKNLEIIHVNIVALMSLTHLYLKDMLQRNEGRILQLASVASFSPNPLLSVYAASKAFVLSFTDALINEIQDTKVTMTALAPDATDTGFFTNANAENTVAGKGKKDAPEDVAKAGYEALMKGEHRLVYGISAKVQVAAGNVMPDELLAKQSRKQFEEE